MQLILVTPRCGTTLQIREVGTLVGNEQRALKLTRVLRIDASIGQRTPLGIYTNDPSENTAEFRAA